MSAKFNPIKTLLTFSGIIVLIILLMQPLELLLFSENISVLFPSGLIAIKQRNLLLFIQIVMLLFVIPIYILTFVFSWWYRAGNKQAKYDPHLIDNTIAEVIWWGVPFIMTVVVCIVTFIKTHELDPYKALTSNKKTIEIQVVALDWKWLFIYPEEKIATINYLQIPKDTPIRFLITADAPMNSFWIPALAGQIYAMPGMRTELNLIADEEGEFRGSSSQVSGAGFAGMVFTTKATNEKDYLAWVNNAQQSQESLDYKEVAKPSMYDPPKVYQLNDSHLFHSILMSYMKPGNQ